jgi:uncharacterized C2H2 Zn-finger protein
MPCWFLGFFVSLRCGGLRLAFHSSILTVKHTAKARSWQILKEGSKKATWPNISLLNSAAKSMPDYARHTGGLVEQCGRSSLVQMIHCGKAHWWVNSNPKAKGENFFFLG